MRYVALICARGGSKGVPGKNIRLLGGKPLIGWAIEAAKQVRRISRVIVSTDSDKIANVALEYGAEVPFIRPANLAADDSPEWLVWRHALNYLTEHDQEQLDGLVAIPSTAPLRDLQDIENCLDEYEKGEVDVVVTYSDAYSNPYFNMVVSDSEGYCSLAVPQKNIFSRRQDAPVVYDLTSVAYVARPQFVNENNAIFEGRVRGVNVPAKRALDIDTPLDFRIAECLICDKLKAME
ncbi:MAG: acylneuraminate cytidylyltransferase family protein [Gammaproteobacteria bacterium]|nr:acylneuraminate cytidylyltransferase family protein [Gammaproteobacteria bacterium]